MGWMASARRQGRRMPRADVTGLAPASTPVRTQSQGGGGGGERGTEMTPSGAWRISMGSWDADMTTMTIVTAILLRIRILASLSSFVINDDGTDVRTRMGGWRAWGRCPFCSNLAQRTKKCLGAVQRDGHGKQLQTSLSRSDQQKGGVVATTAGTTSTATGSGWWMK